MALSSVLSLIVFVAILLFFFRYGVVHLVLELRFYRDNKWDFGKDSGVPVVGGLRMLFGDRYLSRGVHKLFCLSFLSFLFVVMMLWWMNGVL